MRSPFTQTKKITAIRLSLRLLPALLLSLFCASSHVTAQTYINEGFDGSTFPPSTPAPGWTRAIIAGSSAEQWKQWLSSYTTYPSGVLPHGGTSMAYFLTYLSTPGQVVDLKTPPLNFTGASLVQISFWYYKNTFSYPSTGNTDNVQVIINTTSSSTGGTVLGTYYNYYTQPPTTPGAGWYNYKVNIPASWYGPTNYITFRGNSQYGPDFFVDDVQIYNLTPCTGPVSAGTITPAGTSTVCPGTPVTLNNATFTIAGNTVQNWQYSVNGGTSWVTIPGANTGSYTSFPIIMSTKFRFFNVCSNTGDTTYATPVTINVTGGGSFPTYATLPFFEDFESWSTGCSTTDLPSTSWTNYPSTGDRSWRRDDQGASASWTGPANGVYSPAFYKTAHSARFHGYYAVGRSMQGSLSCYVNCSGTGNKELEFYSRLDAGISYPKDSLYVEYSTDTGNTWTLLARYGPGTGNWDFHGGIVLPSTSATTIVRFTASQNYGYTGYTDIYLDAVRISPPCTGKPTAGTIDSVTACVGKNFTLKLTGTTIAAGLTYQWLYKATGSTVGWSPLPGGTVARPTANISVPTTFRAVVTCSNSSMSDTSAPFDVPIAPFYYCYCDVPTSLTTNIQYYGGIGNVTVQTRPANAVLLTNGNPLPSYNSPTVTVGYKSFAKTVPAPTLIRDSTYRFSITTATTYSSGTTTYNYALFFLDTNRNGIWDLPGERIMTQQLSSFPQTLFTDFKIGTTQSIGLTGLRAISGYYLNTSSIPNPCGAWYYQGSAEDYLVRIQYKPCDGPTNAGTAYISDTSICPGYTVDLWDTSYQKDRTGINRMWETSTNLGASYSAIPGSANKDTMTNVVVPASSYGVRYRLRAICSTTGDTTYSNWLNVTNPPAGTCYPYASAAPPGTNDSSDIGSFAIGPYVNPAPMVVSGPHLANPAANKRRTDYTKISPVWTLAADSTYRLAIYHTMRSLTHADAVVSVYIDFNHDGVYSQAAPYYPYPPELIFRGVTHWDSFYLDTKFTMPSNLISGTTGMRVVLNNDLNVTPGLNNGNDGKGTFTSGEVEDYMVNLTRSNLAVNGPNLIQNLALFPNPTSNKATVVFDAPKAISHLDMTVTTIAGQTVLSKSYDNVGQHFTGEVDLSGKAKGIYFVELKADDGQKVIQKLTLQ